MPRDPLIGIVGKPSSGKSTTLNRFAPGPNAIALANRAPQALQTQQLKLVSHVLGAAYHNRTTDPALQATSREFCELLPPSSQSAYHASTQAQCASHCNLTPSPASRQ